jgi:hypothetical protein
MLYDKIDKYEKGKTFMADDNIQPQNLSDMSDEDIKSLIDGYSDKYGSGDLDPADEVALPADDLINIVAGLRYLGGTGQIDLEANPYPEFQKVFEGEFSDRLGNLEEASTDYEDSLSHDFDVASQEDDDSDE